MKAILFRLFPWKVPVKEGPSLESESGSSALYLLKAARYVSGTAQRVSLRNAACILKTWSLRPGTSLAGGVSACCLCLDSDGLIKHSVQALDEGGGVFQRHAFEQQCLIEEQPGGVFYLAVVGVGEQLFDDLVIGVDLERGFAARAGPSGPWPASSAACGLRARLRRRR